VLDGLTQCVYNGSGLNFRVLAQLLCCFPIIGRPCFCCACDEIVEPVMPRLVSGLVMQVVRVVSVGGGRVADGGDF
jgi:hypothetical protein